MRYLYYFLLLVILGSSCAASFTPFTAGLYRESNWTEDELRSIQFWLSEDIVLRRVQRGNLSEIEKGEIKVVEGERVEEVFLPKGTPGVYLFSPKANRLAISFENEGDDKYLIFGPSPRENNRFVLLAKDWNRRSGTVTYGGKLYRVDARSADATLMVDLKKVNRTIIDSRTARGRKVSDD